METKISVLVALVIIAGLTTLFLALDNADFDIVGVLDNLTSRDIDMSRGIPERNWTYLNDILDRNDGISMRVEIALDNLNECKYSCYHSHFMDTYCWFDAVNDVIGCKKGGPDGVIVYWEDL